MEERKNTAGIVLIAKLFVYPGREVEFRRFETQAAQIMRKYDGRIERVLRPTSAAPGETPYKILLAKSGPTPFPPALKRRATQRRRMNPAFKPH